MSVKEKTKSAKEIMEGEKGLIRTYTNGRIYPDETTAKEALNKAKARMYNVNTWSKIPGPENATFVLYDEKGFPYETAKAAVGNFRPLVGDFIKTLLPGNLPEDWVKVTKVSEGADEASFTVRPSHDPSDKNKSDKVTEHFFKNTATSTFKVVREGNKLIASETGINESINNKAPEAGNRHSLNTAISEAGWMFAQKMQWENVTDYIVGNIDIDKKNH